MQRSFSSVILLLISYIYLFFGIFHLIFTKKIGLFVINGINGEITTLLQQFLGASYILTGLLLYLLKKANREQLYIVIGGLNIIGFIHLYLIYLFNEFINLPTLYFVFIILIQICLLIALIEQAKKR